MFHDLRGFGSRYSILRMWISTESALVQFTIDLLGCVGMHFPWLRPREFQGELSVFLCCSRVPAILSISFFFSFLFFSFFKRIIGHNEKTIAV